MSAYDTELEKYHASFQKNTHALQWLLSRLFVLGSFLFGAPCLFRHWGRPSQHPVAHARLTSGSDCGHRPPVREKKMDRGMADEWMSFWTVGGWLGAACSRHALRVGEWVGEWVGSSLSGWVCRWVGRSVGVWVRVVVYRWVGERSQGCQKDMRVSFARDLCKVSYANRFAS